MATLRELADRLLGRRPDQPRLEVPAVPTSDQLIAQLDQFEASIDDRVPPAVESRVTRVAATVRDTIPRLDQLGAGSFQAHAVMATATSYLPEAVGAYLRLPRSWADSRPVSGGKTSLMVLCDQLDLLGYKMDQVLDAVNRADAAALVAHGAFLAEKFSTGGGLDLGAAVVAPDPGGTGSGATGSGATGSGRLQPPDKS